MVKKVKGKMVMENISIQNGSKRIYTNDGKVYKKNTGKTAAGVVAAGIAGEALLIGTTGIVVPEIHKDLQKNMQLFDNSKISSQVKDAFQKSNLEKCGVKIIEATPENETQIAAIMEKEMPKWVDKLPKRIKEVFAGQALNTAQSTIYGENAFYAPKSQSIVVNSEKMGWASFHEMGHALNKNSSKIGKFLQKARTPGMILAGIAATVAIFKRKKVEGEQTKGTVDKATTFVKNHATGLAALGFAPLLAEEGLASIKGAKLAKEILSPENYKILNKLHGKAWLTYGALAGGTVLATAVASKVRDAIASPKRVA
jgi:hypothetical protein